MTTSGHGNGSAYGTTATGAPTAAQSRSAAARQKPAAGPRGTARQRPAPSCGVQGGRHTMAPGALAGAWL